MLATTFLVFVQVCDVCPLVRAHCFSADEVADSLLLTVDRAERTVQLPLPVDLIAVDLMGKYQQTVQASECVRRLLFILMRKLNQCMHHSHLFFSLCLYYSPVNG